MTEYNNFLIKKNGGLIPKNQFIVQQTKKKKQARGKLSDSQDAVQVLALKLSFLLKNNMDFRSIMMKKKEMLINNNVSEESLNAVTFVNYAETLEMPSDMKDEGMESVVGETTGLSPGRGRASEENHSEDLIFSE